MWINNLPNNAIQVSCDGQFVVLREDQQRELCNWLAKERWHMLADVVGSPFGANQRERGK
jgi:hypothetical protein